MKKNEVDEDMESAVQVQCPVCEFSAEFDETFRHGVETHQIFICVCCMSHFKYAKELMVHLYREHRVPPQRFYSHQEFIKCGGRNSVLCCVECCTIFDISNEDDSSQLESHECQRSVTSCTKCNKQVITGLLERHEKLCPGSQTDNAEDVESVTVSAIQAQVRSRAKAAAIFKDNSEVSITIVPVDDHEKEEDEEVKINGDVENGLVNNHLENGNDDYDEDRLVISEAPHSDARRVHPASEVSIKRERKPISRSMSYRKSGTLSPATSESVERPRRTLRKLTNDDFMYEAISKRSYQRSNSLTAGPPALSSSSLSIFPHGRQMSSLSITTGAQSQVSSGNLKFRNQSRTIKPEQIDQKTSPKVHLQFQNMGETSRNYESMESYEPAQEEESVPDVKLDPLLLEPDPAKRLLLLIEELCEKISLEWPGPDMPGYTCQEADDSKYEITINYRLDEKLEDDILTQMLSKTAINCTYCRQVKLIRIDKRQLAIHLFSKHFWDLKFSTEPETKELPDKEEFPTADIKATDVNDGQTSTNLDLSDPAASSKCNELSSGASDTNTIGTDKSTQPQSDEVDSGETAVKSPPHGSESLNEKPVKDNDAVENVKDQPNVDADEKMEVDEEPLPSPPSTSAAEETNDNDKGDTKEAKADVCNSNLAEGQNLTEESEPMDTTDSKQDSTDTKVPTNLLEEPFDESMKIDWKDFKFTVLRKVFLSNNVVFSYKGSGMPEFGDAPCECLLCGYFVDSQKNLFPHWRKIHRGVAMKCAMCQGRFLFAGALYSHLCFGTPNPIIKNEVDRSLTFGSGGKNPPTTLPEHSLGGEFQVVDSKDDDGSADTIVLRYQCNFCEDLQLPGFFNYMVHLRREHNRCELCLEGMRNQKELEHHMKKHKLNHFCWKCGVTYCAKPNFMTHLFWKHGSESKECSICLKKKWPHIYHFCVIPPAFVCDICGFYFTKPKCLVVHRRLHTGEKMKKCPKHNCTEMFISKKLLDRHVETAHNSNTLLAITNDTSDEPVTANGGDLTEKETNLNDENIEKESESEPSEVNPEEPMKPDRTDLHDLETVPASDELVKEADRTDNSSTPPVQLMANDQETKAENEPEAPISTVAAAVAEDVPIAVTELSLTPEKLSAETASVEPSASPLVDKADDGIDGVDEAVKNLTEQQPDTADQADLKDLENPEHMAEENGEGQVALTDDPQKPFNLAEIQGPNLSEEESGSDDESSSSYSSKSPPASRQVSPIAINQKREVIVVLDSSDEEQMPEEKQLGNINMHKVETSTTAKVSSPVSLDVTEPEPKEAATPTLAVAKKNPSPQIPVIPASESMPIVAELKPVHSFGALSNGFVPPPSSVNDNQSSQGPSTKSDTKQVANDLVLSDDSSTESSESDEDNSDDDMKSKDDLDDSKDAEGPSMSNILDHCENLEKNLNQSAMDIDDSALEKSPAEALKKVTTLALDLNAPPDLLLDEVDKMKNNEDFGSMSPLLPPLDDFNFNVPDIPTFEDNSLPEHIIRENAIFSLLHEHDYCLRITLKRRPSSPPLTSSGIARPSYSKKSGEAKHKKLKVMKPKKHSPSKPKKSHSRKRRRSSSSSSSSSSSCGSNCSCSSSSGSSSSSSSGESDSEGPYGLPVRQPHPLQILPPLGPPVKRGRGRPKGSVNRNKDGVPTAKKRAPGGAGKRIGRIIVPKPPKVLNPDGSVPKRKYRKNKGKFSRKSSVHNEKENDDGSIPVFPEENYILETDLETDDSGSEETYNSKQLREVIGSVPAFDEIWTMSNEQYLLKFVRGVKDVEELRPPPPQPKPKYYPYQMQTYSVKQSSNPESRLKVRNVPIKPLIVKRNVPQLIKPESGDYSLNKNPFVRLSPLTHSAIPATSNKLKLQISRIPSPAATPPSSMQVFGRNRVNANPPPLRISFSSPPGTNTAPTKHLHHSVSENIPGSNIPHQQLKDATQPPAIRRPRMKIGSGKGGKKINILPPKPTIPIETTLSAPAGTDEPLYCFCQSPHDNVSQMIGCDAKDCEFQWFHFECVGVTIPPKGKWYCPDCRDKRKQKADVMKKERDNLPSPNEVFVT